MICPVVPLSVADTNVSGANWLDRLRSSRGFPPPTADLDHFLAAPNSASATDPPSSSTLRTLNDTRGGQNGRSERDESMNDILCELFAMGGGGTSIHASNRRKSSRKQKNPKFWDATGSSKKSSNGGSSDDLRRRNANNLNFNNNGLASSGDNSLNQLRKDPGELGLDAELEEAVELKGYSKCEVTVIDSSIQGWKIEMFAFRKKKSKSLWKVREKEEKSRGLMSVRRKRKLEMPNSSEKDDDDEDGDAEEKRDKKKKKIARVSDSDAAVPGLMSVRRKRRLEIPNSSEKDDDDEDGDAEEKRDKKKKKIARVSDSDAAVPLIKEKKVRDDRVEKTLEGVGCPSGEAPIKSFPFSNTHWKSKCEASSVILVKPISTFDKSGTRKAGKMSVNKGQCLL